MTYEELVKNDTPRWVVYDLFTRSILAECWTWSNANFAALQRERNQPLHTIRIYDRMDENDMRKMRYI